MPALSLLVSLALGFGSAGIIVATNDHLVRRNVHPLIRNVVVVVVLAILLVLDALVIVAVRSQ